MPDVLNGETAKVLANMMKRHLPRFAEVEVVPQLGSDYWKITAEWNTSIVPEGIYLIQAIITDGNLNARTLYSPGSISILHSSSGDNDIDTNTDSESNPTIPEAENTSSVPQESLPSVPASEQNSDTTSSPRGCQSPPKGQLSILFLFGYILRRRWPRKRLQSMKE